MGLKGAYKSIFDVVGAFRVTIQRSMCYRGYPSERPHSNEAPQSPVDAQSEGIDRI